MKTNNLTIKQEAFCQAYVKSGDKSEAYRSAYNCSRLKDKSIHELSSKLSKNVKVASRLKELQDKISDIADKQFNITHEEILNHLNILRNSRIDEYVEYVEYEFPIIETTTTGTGKNAVTTTSTRIELRKELRFKPFDKLTKEQLMCIESIKQNRYGEIELKLHGKDWTIDKINKHIGFYETDNKQKNPPVVEVNDETNIDARIQALLDKSKGKK